MAGEAGAEGGFGGGAAGAGAEDRPVVASLSSVDNKLGQSHIPSLCRRFGEWAASGLGCLW